MAQPSHNSLGSVLPQLGPLCSTIHSPGSWVRWPKPSWILSLGFIGWQLIYPLYTFQIIGLSLQGRKEEPQRGEKKHALSPLPFPQRLHQTLPHVASTCVFGELQQGSVSAASWSPKLPQPSSQDFLRKRDAAHVAASSSMQPTAGRPGRPTLRYWQACVHWLLW